MAICHARTGISHHIPDLLSHRRLITMHFAVGTGSFPVLERTLAEACFRIIQKLAALMTWVFMRFMLISAVDLYHSLNSYFLSFYPLFFAEHEKSQ